MRSVCDTGGPARKAKSTGTPKKRSVSRSKAANSNNNNGTINVTTGHGHSGSSSFGNANHTGVNTHNIHTNNSSSDHQSSRPLSAHRPRAQSAGHNLESRGLGDGSGTRGERKQTSQVLHQEKHFTPTRGQGQGQGQTGLITHTPIAHIHTSVMPSPSSRYEEQLRNSLESLVFESISSVEQETVRVRPPAPHMRGSPQRPRSAPSPVSGSPMSLRGKGANAGLGLGLDGTTSGKERGGGIAALGRGESNRRVSPRSHSTDRVRHDTGRDGQGLGTRPAFTDTPIYLPQRISGRPPMTPSHAHTPLAPRAAPHSTLKSASNRPLSHSSVPSYARA